jgi:hypothetical protein
VDDESYSQFFQEQSHVSLKDWFRRKRGPKKIGTSKGGSDLLKYDNADPPKPQMGFQEESTLPQTEDRERIYGDFFGPSDGAYHELVPLIPHIDVYCYPPNAKREFYTFVTGGMSDMPMHSPPELGRDCRRIELVFYAADDEKQYAEFLRNLGHFAHDNDTWLHWGHTMPNGNPPSPLFGEGPLDTIFFMPSIVTPDCELGGRLTIESDPVNLVWCVPITTAECQLKLDHGTDALYDLFDANNHPFVFRGQRASYV